MEDRLLRIHHCHHLAASHFGGRFRNWIVLTVEVKENSSWLFTSSSLSDTIKSALQIPNLQISTKVTKCQPSLENGACLTMPRRLFREIHRSQGITTMKHLIANALPCKEERIVQEYFFDDQKILASCQAVLNNDIIEIPSSQSRVVFCGTGRAGKSSTRRSFLNKKFKNLDSTLGVDISRVTCKAVKEGDSWEWKVSQEDHDFQAALYALSCCVESQEEHAAYTPGATQTDPSSNAATTTSTASDDGVGQQSQSVAKLIDYINDHPFTFEKMLGEVKHFIDLWDCGGQQAFAAFQQFTISARQCAYPIMYDASKELTDPLNETLSVQGHERRILTKAKDLTTYDVIEGWLDVLQRTAEAENLDLSNIFFYFVGCKADKLAKKGYTKAEKLEKDMKYIQKQLKARDKPYAKHITDNQFFLISNKKSGTRHADPDLLKLCNQITKDVMSYGDTYKMKARWLPFAEALQMLQEKRRNCGDVLLTVADASVLAEKACHITSEKELFDLLEFFHHIGRILYFRHNKQLQEVVFIDIPGLVKLITSLFIPPDKDLVIADGAFKSRYKMFYKRGVLLESLMHHIWKQRCQDIQRDYKDHLELVFELMGEYGLLYETGRRIRAPRVTTRSREFLLPSMAMMPAYMDDGGKAAEWHASLLYDQLKDSTVLIGGPDDRSLPEETFWRVVVLCLRRLSGKGFVHDSPVSILYRSASVRCSVGDDQCTHRLQLTYMKCGVGVHIACDNSLDSMQMSCVRSQLLKIVEESLEATMGSKHEVTVAAWCPEPGDEPCTLHPDCRDLDCQHFVERYHSICPEGHPTRKLWPAYCKLWGTEKNAVLTGKPSEAAAAGVGGSFSLIATSGISECHQPPDNAIIENVEQLSVSEEHHGVDSVLRKRKSRDGHSDREDSQKRRQPTSEKEDLAVCGGGSSSHAAATGISEHHQLTSDAILDNDISLSKKRKSKDVHSDEEGYPKKRKPSGGESMGGRTQSSNADEILLQRSSPCLREISRYFLTIDEVNGLATYLLQDLPTGGRSFVNSLPASSSVPDKAHSVLDEWCRMYPAQSCGQHLYDVLKIKHINPLAAEKFKAKLVLSNPATLIQSKSGQQQKKRKKKKQKK